jgi:hypothetical protein
MPHPTTHQHDEHDVRVVHQLVATLHALGQTAYAESLLDLVASLRHEDPMVPDEVPAPAGWQAVVYLAHLAGTAPTLPRVGDRVRVTYPDGVATGVWEYRTEPGDRANPFRAAFADDETGRLVDDFSAAHVEVTRMANRITGWDRQVHDAAVALGSAWTSTPEVERVAAGCVVCEPGQTRCTHAPGCVCLTCRIALHERPRWCACGERTRFTVHAWSAVPQYAAAVGIDEGQAADVEFEIPLYEPGESGMGYVCSATCARNWVTWFQPRAVESMGADDAAELRYRMAPWTFTPSDDQVPDALARARTAAARLHHLVDHVVGAWYRRDPRPQAFADVKAQAARLVQALADVPEGSTTRHLWRASPVALAGDLDSLGEDMRDLVEQDPGRYEIGLRVVFDRVEQVYLCAVCPGAARAVAFHLPQNLRATLEIGFGMKMTCPRCAALLLP